MSIFKLWILILTILLLNLFIFSVAKESLHELSVHTVCKLLLRQKRITSGPDKLPYWFWNTYAYDIAPVITTIFNRSIKLDIVRDEWKLANLLSIPKEFSCTELNQLRPISLTNIIVRLLESTCNLYYPIISVDGKSIPWRSVCI